VADATGITRPPDSTEEVDEPACPRCGYDLRGITSNRCPECAFAFDRATLSVSRIPWEHGDEISWFRAFWDTTGFVIWHPRLFAQEAGRPVNYRRARQFQLTVVFCAWAAVMPWAISGMAAVRRDDWYVKVFFVLCLVIVPGLFLLLATGVASYWFHPGTISVVQQDRAIALSYYACAPLAWLWIPSLLFIATVRVDQTLAGMTVPVAILVNLGPLFLAAILLDWLLATCLLMADVTRSDGRRQLLFALALPALWGACLCLAVAIPAALTFMAVVHYSFR